LLTKGFGAVFVVDFKISFGFYDSLTGILVVFFTSIALSLGMF